MLSNSGFSGNSLCHRLSFLLCWLLKIFPSTTIFCTPTTISGTSTVMLCCEWICGRQWQHRGEGNADVTLTEWGRSGDEGLKEVARGSDRKVMNIIIDQGSKCGTMRFVFFNCNFMRWGSPFILYSPNTACNNLQTALLRCIQPSQPPSSPATLNAETKQCDCGARPIKASQSIAFIYSLPQWPQLLMWVGGDFTISIYAYQGWCTLDY